MKLLIKPSKYVDAFNKFDGLILPIKDFSTDYDTYFTLDEIRNIKEKFNKEIFVVVNRMFFNEDIDSLKELLLEIDKLNITGIFYYDLAVLELKRELDLKTDLVWNATFMVTNYKTCNYYYNKGVKYAYLANEITFDEVLEIKEKSNIIPMFTLFSYPTVATSRRSLVTNYQVMNNLEKTSEIEVEEKITKEKYLVKEDQFGTTFKYGKILNNISVLNKLREVDFPYLVCNEDGIDHETFMKVLDNLDDIDLVNSLIGENTGFLNRKTIYKVKRNG